MTAIQLSKGLCNSAFATIMNILFWNELRKNETTTIKIRSQAADLFCKQRTIRQS